ncbi:MAG: Rid family hydrolase [Treponemataceae bacterium]
MPKVSYPPVAGLPRNPAFSEVAVIPSGASLVWIGGQNAVGENREIVGKGDATAQAARIKERIELALKTAGCSWADVVRLQVYLVAGVDPRASYSVFAPALASRETPPLVGVYQVVALAHPDFLLEVSVEAVKP